MRRSLLFILSFILFSQIEAKLDCDPTSNVKKPDPANPESYLYCNLEGSFSKRKCLSGKIFNGERGECESFGQMDDPSEDPLSQPFYQAPDDLCGSGIPLTILSAPVACNPSISSCPDGYVCRMYERTGTSYCCQGSSSIKDDTMCSKDQTTYVTPSNGRPQSCVLSKASSCPTGFGCELVGGTITRCCGKSLGCPFNSAALLNPNSASHVECSPSNRNACQRGFTCTLSSTLGKHICCSTVTGTDSFTCPGGESALSSPSSCSANSPCPTGYVCKDEKCCPSAGVCPAGLPLGGSSTSCNEKNPCREGYQCVTTGGIQYCCPSKEKVCSLARNAGVECTSSRPAVTRYYFDSATGSCRSFQFSQCGGNSNNFQSLEECEGFCVDSQCQNGQAYRVGAVNAACSLSALNTCPKDHFCENPVFGPSPICCPTAELTCNEMVSAGTPCFGRSVTIQKFYFNPSTRKCQAFQYYGCNGNGNNFDSMEQCSDHCLSAIDNVCGGATALMDPNQQPQRCTSNVPCPSGYECNEENFCCPSAATACSASISRGNVCSHTPQRTMWHYDTSTQKCSQFVYHGCGGTANRFSSEKSCKDFCVSASNSGSCPRGMNPHIEKGDLSPKSCTLNVRGTCPSTSSCVRSTTNQPICCQTVTSCPDNRTPYVIPGSNSVVACNVDADDCPDNNLCVESSTVPGFHMCCSTTQSNNQRPPAMSRQGRGRTSETLAALIRNISPCPPGLHSNGQTCQVNAIGDCPHNHLCIRDVGYEEGTCCRTSAPKCSQKGFIPVFLASTQVQVCQIDIGGCPHGSRCTTSSVPTLAICCKKSVETKPMNRGDNMNTGSSTPTCKSGERPFESNGQLQQCNFVQNTCPSGYRCEFSSNGLAVCCSDSESIKCPSGSSVFEYGGRPLACPPGSNKCPHGYSCLPSQNPMFHLCCSSPSGSSSSFGGIQFPQCSVGVAYVNPVSNQRQFCSPLSDNCPIGYRCLESDINGQYICCTQGNLEERFKGFCPPRQLPHVSRAGFPPTCHMQLNPCPTTAPYVCIYSPEKQDSYCCAPIDTAVRSFRPDRPDGSQAAPMKSYAINTPQFPPHSNPNRPNLPSIPTHQIGGPRPGMSQTFPGGPQGNIQGPVAIPDPIPGVSNDKILPPGMVQPSLGGPTRTFASLGTPNQGVPYNGANTGMGVVNNMGATNMGTVNMGGANTGGFNGQPNTAEHIAQMGQIGQQMGLQLGKLGPNTVGSASVASSVSGSWNVMGGPITSTTTNGIKGIITQISGNDFSFASGCPLGSRPLVHMGKSVAECADQPCPEGFACVFAEKESRFQCCSSSSIMLAASRPSEETTPPPTIGSSGMECPTGFYMIDGKCLKVLFAGQKGCLTDEQCSAREANATCDSGYCVCPADKPLVHGGQCISSCPEGFANIAGRCYDPTTVIFMDSVDERGNGTIGGYCLDTLVEEKRCHVENSYCSEKTITCQCKPGFDLNMDFENKDDKGSCRQMETSKFAHSEPRNEMQIDEELYFIDIGPAKAVEDASFDSNSTSNTSNDDENLNKYLFQADELIPAFM